MPGSLKTWGTEWDPKDGQSTENQAQIMFKELKERAQKGEKTAIVYSANNQQAESLHRQNETNQSPPYDPNTIVGSGQATVFHALLRFINQDSTELSSEHKKNIRILPIATSMKGGNDGGDNAVSEKELMRDIEIIKQHVDQGWDVVAPPRLDANKKRPATPNQQDQFGIGGGNSQSFIRSTNDQKWTPQTPKTRNQFVQEQLNRIQNNEPLLESEEQEQSAKTDQGTNVTITSSRTHSQQNSDTINNIIKEYNITYATPRRLPNAEKQEDGSIRLHFENVSDAVTFMKQQAAKGRSFLVRNEQGEVLGFAKNGKFFNADNTPCTENTFGAPMKSVDFLKQQLQAEQNLLKSATNTGNGNPVLRSSTTTSMENDNELPAQGYRPG